MCYFNLSNVACKSTGTVPDSVLYGQPLFNFSLCLGYEFSIRVLKHLYLTGQIISLCKYQCFLDIT